MTDIDSKYLTSNALTLIAFSQADQNINGKIDKEEESIFTKALEKLGDADKNGKISEDEAKTYSGSLEYTMSEEQISAEKRFYELKQQYDFNNLKDLPIDVMEEYKKIFEQAFPQSRVNVLESQSKLLDMIKQYHVYIKEVMSKGVIPNIKGDSSFFNDFFDKPLDKSEDLTPPMKMGEGWGLEDEHIEYVFAKLEQAGIPRKKVNIEKLVSSALSSFDYALDENEDGMISPKEAETMSDGGWASKYLNKDKNGKTIDTHILDWMVNKYIAESKKAE